jgi:hypothetical protein
MKMKQLKLLSLVALVLSLSVTAVFAETGKVGSDEVSGKMCEKLAASLIKKQEAANAQTTTAPAKVVPAASTAM